MIRRLGIDIVRVPYNINELRSRDQFATFVKILSKYNIDLVLDVGANTGQYAMALIEAGYKGKIVSFEPLSNAHRQLLINTRSYPNWKAAERCAIGDFDGEIEINISQNLASSSILPVLASTVSLEPAVEYTGSEKVNIFKLSTVARSYMESAKSVYLKIDVQGVEDKVIEGALELLPVIKGMAMELSMVPLYDGQVLIEEMISRMRKLGYVCCDLFPAFVDQKTGKLLQVDGIFVK